METKVQQCLDLCMGPTDEHKFAGLLMVTKHCTDLEASVLENLRVQVVEALGATFLLRLLRTSSSSDPSQSTVSIYQSLGVSLISTFCHDQDALRKQFPDQIKLLDYIALILSSSRSTEVTLDCIECFQHCLFSSTDEWSCRMHHYHALVLELYLRHDPELERPCAFLLQQLYSSYPFARLWTEDRVTQKSLTKCCLEFGTLVVESFEMTIEILRSYFHFLLSQEDAFPSKSTSTTLDSRAQNGLRNGIMMLLQSKISMSRRDDTFHLFLLSCQVFGFHDFVFADLDHHSQDKTQQRIQWLLKLAGIEIKLLLDAAEDYFIDMDGGARSRTTPNDHVQLMVRRLFTVLPVYYQVIECTIEWLCGEELESILDLVSMDCLFELKKSLEDVMSVVLNYIVVCRDYLDTHAYDHITRVEAQETLGKYQQEFHLILCTTIRLLGTWSAQESASFRLMMLEVYPFVLTYEPPCRREELQVEDCDSDGDSDDEPEVEEKLLRIEPRAMTHDLLFFLLPGLALFTSVEDREQDADDPNSWIVENKAIQERLLLFCTRCHFALSSNDEPSMVTEVQTREALMSLSLCFTILLQGMMNRSGTLVMRKQHCFALSCWTRYMPILNAFHSKLVDVFFPKDRRSSEPLKNLMYAELMLRIQCLVILYDQHTQPQTSSRAQVEQFQSVWTWMQQVKSQHADMSDEFVSFSRLHQHLVHLAQARVK